MISRGMTRREFVSSTVIGGTAGVGLVSLASEVVDYSFLRTLLIENGFPIRMFREEDVNLETAFLELTQGVQQ